MVFISHSLQSQRQCEVIIPLLRPFFHSARPATMPARIVWSSHKSRIAGETGVQGRGLNSSAETTIQHFDQAFAETIDNDVELSAKRDLYERSLVKRYQVISLSIRNDLRVLGVGCQISRWAELSG